MTGLLLILTAIATVVAVVGRVSADADHETLAASLAAIAASRGLYGLGGAGRFVSGVTLIASAWFLFNIRSDGGRRGSPVVPLLFAASGALTACSGLIAVRLAAMPPEWMDVTRIEGVVLSHQEATVWLRRFTGAVGFALVGLALMVAARRQWSVGGKLKRVAPASALLGLAIQFVWFDAATVMHIVTGTLFVVWLSVGGGMLLKGQDWIPDRRRAS